MSGLEKEYPALPLMLTEYGADANLDHQTEELGDALDWSKPYYPETYQTKVHEHQWSVIERHPYILASYLWNTFDFACPMWSRGGVPARNLKGLVTFDRKTRKDAFYWYKANWSEEPVLYLTQRRNVERERATTSVTVYSNLERNPRRGAHARRPGADRHRPLELRRPPPPRCSRCLAPGRALRILTPRTGGADLPVLPPKNEPS